MFNTIEIRQNRDRQSLAYITGTRIRVLDIVMDYEYHGISADEIAVSYPHLTLSQVHSALAYYFENRNIIQQQIRENEQFVAMMQQSLEHGLTNKKAPV